MSGRGKARGPRYLPLHGRRYLCRPRVRPASSLLVNWKSGRPVFSSLSPLRSGNSFNVAERPKRNMEQLQVIGVTGVFFMKFIVTRGNPRPWVGIVILPFQREREECGMASKGFRPTTRATTFFPEGSPSFIVKGIVGYLFGITRFLSNRQIGSK